MLKCGNRSQIFASQGVQRVSVASRNVVACRASANRPETKLAVSRRDAVGVSLAGFLWSVTPNTAFAAKAPKGYNPVKDKGDKYQFLYPFGWQEVTVEGQDAVYKDLIEPLENVSVTITPTEKTDITEFGELGEVAFTLADNVLTGPNQKIKVLNTSERNLGGINYYEVEFAVDGGNYLRHALAVVCAWEGKFYVLSTGANEKRWNKMKDKLLIVAKSFQVNPSF